MGAATLPGEFAEPLLVVAHPLLELLLRGSRPMVEVYARGARMGTFRHDPSLAQAA